MDVRDVTCTVRVGRNWHNEGRRYQIANLYSHVVIAMSKGRQFHDSWVVGLFGAEFLRENRVRDGNIQAFCA